MKINGNNLFSMVMALFFAIALALLFMNKEFRASQRYLKQATEKSNVRKVISIDKINITNKF